MLVSTAYDTLPRAMTRIAFIGAGSVEFTRHVLADVLSYPDLGDVTIALHDISGERLARNRSQ